MGGNWGGSNSSQSGRPLTINEMTPRYYAGLYNILSAAGEDTPEIISKDDWVKANIKPVQATDEWGQLVSHMPRQKDIDKQYSAYVNGQMRQTKLDAPEYETPSYASLGGGDYDRLEQSIVKSRTSPLNSAWSRRKDEITQDMADRGLWASGIDQQVKNDTFSRDFLPAYEQAGAEAAAQRYGLEQKDLEGKNAFGLTTAAKKYESEWMPYDKLMALWSGSGGTITKGKSDSSQIGFSI